MTRSRVLGLLLALLMLANAYAAPSPVAAAVPASGAGVSASSKVTVSYLDYEGAILRTRGKVAAKAKACRGGRSVRLGLRTTTKLWPADRARSDRTGRYRLRMDIDEVQPDGDVRWVEVRAMRKVVRVNGRRVVCKAAVVRASPARVRIHSVTAQGANTHLYGGVTGWIPECNGRRLTVHNVTDGVKIGSPVPDNADWASGGAFWTLDVPAATNGVSERYRVSVPGKRTTAGGQDVLCARGVFSYQF